MSTHKKWFLGLFLSVLIHALFLLFYFVKKHSLLKANHSEKEKVMVVKIKREEKKKKGKKGMARLDFSLLGIGKKVFVEEKSMKKGDEGASDCFVDILKSIGRYPNSFFHHDIVGSGLIKISFDQRGIHIKEENYSHHFVSSLLCDEAINKIKMLRGVNCLKSMKKPSHFTYRLQLELGENRSESFHSISPNSFVKKIVRMKKPDAKRVVLAVANIFTLLELHESEKETLEWLNFKQKYAQFSCHFDTEFEKGRH